MGAEVVGAGPTEGAALGEALGKGPLLGAALGELLGMPVVGAGPTLGAMLGDALGAAGPSTNVLPSSDSPGVTVTLIMLSVVVSLSPPSPSGVLS